MTKQLHLIVKVQDTPVAYKKEIYVHQASGSFIQQTENTEKLYALHTKTFGFIST